MRVWLGCERCYDDDRTYAPDDERDIGPAPGPTYIAPPDGMALGEVFTSITAAGGVWDRQSPDEKPLWVASDDPKLAGLLAAHWDVEDRSDTQGVAG